MVETGAGEGASFTDEALADAGATIVPDEAAALSGADIVLKVQRPMTADEGGPDELALMKSGALLVGILALPTASRACRRLCLRGRPGLRRWS